METSKSMNHSITYQIFGSESSLDLDVCFFVEKVASISENNEVLNRLITDSNLSSDKKINGNLAVISNGTVVNCFKGIPDELNNSLFYTYDLHSQNYEQQIVKTIKRNLDLKMIRGARTLVSYFTRTEERAASKSALKSNFEEKIKFLQSINLNSFSDFDKNGTVIEVYKSIAFQLGQTLALMDEVELYTKEAISSYFSSLNPYLYKEQASSDELQIKLTLFVERSLKYLPQMLLSHEPVDKSI